MDAQDGWSEDVFSALKANQIKLVATVPDGGLTALLQLCDSDNEITVVTLTSEQEGVALATGSWLGGIRCALLMQSSGVGNCINMLSLPAITRIPMLMLVTMRGEAGERNPWQIPMGSRVPQVFETMGVTVHRPDRASDVGDTFGRVADDVFASGHSAAVLISQHIIGTKEFDKPGGVR